MKKHKELLPKYIFWDLEKTLEAYMHEQSSLVEKLVRKMLKKECDYLGPLRFF